MTITIREATGADWPAIYTLIATVAAGGDTYALPTDISDAEARRYWYGDDHQVFVAEYDGTFAGTYSLRTNRLAQGSHVANAGYMVNPDNAGSGIGAALCEHSLATARAAGYRAMQFNFVVSTNIRAVALWQRMGFAIVGTVPQAYLHATLGFVDAHVMHRFL